jgi:hypothetical protein
MFASQLKIFLFFLQAVFFLVQANKNMQEKKQIVREISKSSCRLRSHNSMVGYRSVQ